MLSNPIIYGEGLALVNFYYRGRLPFVLLATCIHCCLHPSVVYGYAVPIFEFITLFAS